MNLKVDDVVLCKVTKIEGATVFLKVEDSNESGSMMLSEVAAGRIRNLRDYVSLNRKIVCKVLKVFSDHLEFSLRRVTTRERELVLENYKKERAFANMLKVAGEKPESIISKIKESYDMVEFFEEARENSKVLEKFLSKDKAKKVGEILKEKTGKDKVVVAKVSLKSDSEKGVLDIQEVLDIKDAEIHYLGSGKFSVSVSAEDFKEAAGKLDEVLEEIEKRAKKKSVLIQVKKEK